MSEEEQKRFVELRADMVARGSRRCIAVLDALVVKWTFTTFHNQACRTHLEDPGARCICRPGRREECACGSGCAPRTGCRSEPTQDVPFREGR